MEIGRLGVWTWLDALSPDEAADVARKIEAWGYSALWIPEAVGADPFATHAWLASPAHRRSRGKERCSERRRTCLQSRRSETSTRWGRDLMSTR